MLGDTDMIKVKVFKKDGIITGVDVSGHAGYADHGEDIVCAAVSALVINTINSIETFTEDAFGGSSDPNGGHVAFHLKENISNDSILLLNSLILGLEGIRDGYGEEYIKLIIKEV